MSIPIEKSHFVESLKPAVNIISRLDALEEIIEAQRKVHKQSLSESDCVT